MVNKKGYTPQHCQHKRSGRGYVCLDGKQFPTGVWGTPEAEQCANQLISGWLANGRTLPAVMKPRVYRVEDLVAEYNREKDRVTVEAAFAKLIELAASLDAEQRRAADEGLSEDECALFQMLFRESISASDREKLKQASRSLLASLTRLLETMHDWTKNAETQAEVRISILDHLFQTLPRPPFTDAEAEALAGGVYDYVWEQSRTGHRLGEVAA